MSKYTYYPGCSVKGTGKAYEESLLAVFRSLGVDLHELEDWNCCGATAYMSIDEWQSFALAGRNLALAENNGNGEVVAPCSACYLVLQKTQRYMEQYPEVRERVGEALDSVGMEYRGTTKIRHPLDVLVNDVGLDAIKERVVTPLKGLKVAPYYGCQIVRPYALFDSQHTPDTMDRLLTVAGAEVVDYPLKTRCCGASHTGTLPKIGLHLVYGLLREAVDRGADMIATLCPLCQFNLDAHQDEAGREYDPVSIPVVYFTQVLGLALGLTEEELGLKRGIVPVEPVLARRTTNV